MPKRITTEQFIEKARAVHGDKYDYSKVVYIRRKNKVKVVCPLHGDFLVRGCKHLVGRGCPKCRGKTVSPRKLTTEIFIQRAKARHGDRYDYSKAVYTGSNHKIEIGCKKHGFFWVRASSHLGTDKACPKCGKEANGKKHKRTHAQFLVEAQKRHGDKYRYLTEYTHSQEYLSIECVGCGLVFESRANNHLFGSDCPKCSKGKSERLFGECLEELGYEAYKNRPEWLINPVSGWPLELDYYIPELKIAFEVQGRQHYEPIARFGGVSQFQKQQARDQQKRNLCFMKGVTLYEYDLRIGKDKESMMAYLTKILKPKIQTRSFHDQILELIQKR